MKRTKFLRNTDISSEYNVSKPTVTRWLEMAKDSKNNLQLDSSNKIIRVVDNEHNRLELQRLSKNATTYKPKNVLSKTIISNKFYDIFSYDELIEILNDLRYSQMIKEKYFYKKAKYWNDFYFDSLPIFNAVTKNFRSSTIFDINYLVKEKEINIIDIGIGNAYPIKDLILELESQKRVKQYIGVDISEEMIEIARQNFTNWFPKIKSTFYNSDIEKNRLGTFFTETIGVQEDSPSIIMLRGGTICNIDDRIVVYKHIASPMKKSDLFVVEFSLDSNESKLDIEYMDNNEFMYDEGWPLEIMGVDIKECEVVVEYNEAGYKDKYFKLDKDYDIEFNYKNIQFTLKTLKGEKISVWRHYLFSIETFLKEIRVAGLKLVALKLDNSGKYAMAMCIRA